MNANKSEVIRVHSRLFAVVKSAAPSFQANGPNKMGAELAFVTFAPFVQDLLRSAS
jgi:hypothetical protein